MRGELIAHIENSRIDDEHLVDLREHQSRVEAELDAAGRNRSYRLRRWCPSAAAATKWLAAFLDRLNRFFFDAGMVDRPLFPRAAKVAPKIVAIKRRR